MPSLWSRPYGRNTLIGARKRLLLAMSFRWRGLEREHRARLDVQGFGEDAEVVESDVSLTALDPADIRPCVKCVDHVERRDEINVLHAWANRRWPAVVVALVYPERRTG